MLIGRGDELDKFLDDIENVSYYDLRKDYASTSTDDDGASFEFNECLSM